MKASSHTVFFLIVATLSLSALGCCSRLLPNKLFASREKEAKVPLNESMERVVSQNEEFETILQIGGKARRITPSADSKRVLIERESYLDEEKPQNVDINLSNSAESENDLNVELWNLDFSTATQEEFHTNEYLLTLQKSDSATFSTQGDRLFWLGREPIYDESQGEEKVDGYSAPAPSFTFRNVVLTKTFRLSVYNSQNEAKEEQTTQDSNVKHLKTDYVVKTASRLRLSPKARWIICRATSNASGASNQNEQTNASKSEEIKTDFLYDLPSWLLVYVPNGKRVVRFPETIKMTFDSSTSDETIKGRVVDVLDVSDEGDLVATLVEELPQESPKEEKNETIANATTQRTQGWNPRYKIVVWDLQVVRTVDLEKKRSALYALEVSQIPIKSPISPSDCRFSTDGKVLAAKVEPRLISVWQTANGRLKGDFWEDDGFIRDFALASNGMRLVVGIGNKAGELLLWDVRTGVLQKNARFPQTKSIDAVAFFNSDKQVLFVDSEGVVKRWNVDVASVRNEE